jgi:hypothetical protein
LTYLCSLLYYHAFFFGVFSFSVGLCCVLCLAICVCFIGVCVALCVRAIKAMLSSPFFLQCMLPSRPNSLIVPGREILPNALQ